MGEALCVERTPGQWIAYKVVTANSGILSILGSTAIILMIFRGRAGLARLQNRLLVCMSFFDILGSLAFTFSTAPIPSGSNCAYGAIGNRGTCIAQGILVQLGLVVPCYNAMLSVYYLAVIKYNVSDDILAKYEPLMHVISIAPSLTVITIACLKDYFNNYTILCWLSERERYNEGFIDGADEFLPALFAVSLFFSLLVFLVIGFCMTALYLFVRDRETAMNAYRFGHSIRSIRKSSKKKKRSSLSNTVQDTRKQAFLYVGSFFITYMFTIVMLIYDVFFRIAVPYEVLLLQGLFCPLQGFWNFLAYVRPRFNLVTEENEEKSMLHRLYITVFVRPKNRPGLRGSRGHRSTGSRRPRSSGNRSSISGNRQPRSLGNRGSTLGTGRPLVQPNGAAAYNNNNNNKSNVVKFPVNNLKMSSINDFEEDDHYSSLQMIKISSQQKNHRDASASSTSQLAYDEESCRDVGIPPLENYRKAVTLSLLVAEDILPRRPHRHNRGRRMSMTEGLPDNIEWKTIIPNLDNTDRSQIIRQDFSNDMDDEEAPPPLRPTVRPQRRKSCPGVFN